MLNKDYALKAEVLKNKYSKIFEEFAFAACKDDRIVAVNVLNQLLTACKGMTITNNPYICNAVNQAISQDCERIDRIVTRFTGRVYKDCRWQNKSEIMEDDAGEITEEMIEKGVEKCLVNFIVDPNSNHGTVCSIGEHWFYFGGHEAESSDPDDFIFNVPREDVVREIHGVLCEFKHDPNFRVEYAYYFHFLVEGLRNSDEPLKENDDLAAENKDELAWMMKFASESFFDDELARDQLRMLWTAYCLHTNRIVDTVDYDSDLMALWNAVSECETETADWSDFDSFDLFMCKYLV